MSDHTSDLPNLVGHIEPQSALLAMFAGGRLPHALLFHGPQGVGKRLAAEILARRLLCGPSQGGDASGRLTFNTDSPVFPQIVAGSCPDLHHLAPDEGKKAITINQVREVLKALSLASDAARIIIVDGAEAMTTSAANALLKTLEEPGADVHIVLISHQLSALLPTIVSRCRQLRFGPLAQEEVQRILAIQMPDKSADELDNLTRLAQGSPGRALQLVGEGETVARAMEDFFAQFSLSNPGPDLATRMMDAFTSPQKAEMGVDILLHHLATRGVGAVREGRSATDWQLPPALCGDLYQRILSRQQQMWEYNLSPQLTLETSLLDVVSSIHA